MNSGYLTLLRPHQWLKNLMLLFPPFLGGAIFDEGLLVRSILPLISFCCASSFAYIVNDIMDAANDALHPVKKHRPIPAGTVTRQQAFVLAVVMIVGALISAILVSHVFLLMVLVYLIINVSYSIKLKELPLVDIFCISAGFLIRLFAGGEAFGIVISDWLFLSVFLLAIFLSTGKRLCEMKVLGDNAGEHRRALRDYPEGFLDGMMSMSGSAVLVTYTMYVINRPVLIWSVPLCCYGLFRYILRVKSGLSGDPTESLLKDRQLLIVGLLWVAIIGWGTYA